MKLRIVFFEGIVYNLTKMIIRVKFLLIALILILVSGGTVLADYACEVMTLRGKATAVAPGEAVRELKEGDIVKEGDTIRVEEGTLDLAFDKDWNNVTRLAQNTEVEVRSIYPTGLVMARGDIFARLERLPKNSTFEIQTPTCVAAVRGSAYRTIHEEGESRVLNYASSPVEVFGLDSEGNLLDNPVVLAKEEKTGIKEAGESPSSPEKMTEAEIKESGQFQSDVKDEVQELSKEGRVGKVQEIEEVDREYSEGLEQRINEKITESTEEPVSESGGGDLEQEDSLENSLTDETMDSTLEQTENIVSSVQESVTQQSEITEARQQDETQNTEVGAGGVGGTSDTGTPNTTLLPK